MAPALNPNGRARVLEAPSRPMLVIGRSFYEEMLTREETITGDDWTIAGEETTTGGDV